MLQRTHSFTLLMAVTSLAVPLGFLNDWFVDQNAPDCATGTGGPQDPFCTIARAIAEATDGDRILIAAGRYQEHLVLDEDLELVGMAGAAVTTVAGIQLRSVVTQSAGTVVVLDGLTITGGLSDRGAGIRIDAGEPSMLTLTNATVSQNRCQSPVYEETGRGGGLYVPAGATVVVQGSSFLNNTAVGPSSSYFSSIGSGGAIHNEGSTTVVSSRFSGNNARIVSFGVTAEERGNAIANHGTFTLIDSLVVQNGIRRPFGTPGGGGRGAAIYSRAPFTITNTTIADNLSGRNPGFGYIYEEALDVTASTTIENSVVWNNLGGSFDPRVMPTVTYTVVEGGWPGVGNLDQDPLFVDPLLERWDVQPGSPCIDAGDPLDAPRGVDFGGNLRWLDGRLDGTQRVDMGAVEFSNVRLFVIGETLNDVTIEATGTAGLEVFLSVARAPGESPVPPWGRTLFAPRSLWFVFALGPVPVSRRLPVPNNASLFGRGNDVVLQALALGRPLGGGVVPGNFSNAVRLGLD